METFYFIATVANCNSNIVKVKTKAGNRGEAMRNAADRLHYHKIDPIHIQNCAEAQYNINTVMDIEDVFEGKLQVMRPALTKNPVFPV